MKKIKYNHMERGVKYGYPDFRCLYCNRIETLVQNLLGITKLDAGTIIIEKSVENIADMIKDIELHFAYQAKQERNYFIRG